MSGVKKKENKNASLNPNSLLCKSSNQSELILDKIKSNL